MGGRLEVSLFGRRAIRVATRPFGPIQLTRRKSLALFVYLATSAGQLHYRGALSTMLWGETPDSNARHSLRQALLNIRTALESHGIEVLRTNGDTVSLDPAGLRVDATLFERLLERGTPASIRMGLRLYRGDFLEGIHIDEPAFDDWMVMHRLRLRQRAIEAHEAVMQHSAMNGHSQDAIHFALKLLAMDPLLESAHRALIRLYANAGQIGAALRQYENCVRALDVELQVGPQAETVELVRELRRGRPRADIMPSLT